MDGLLVLLALVALAIPVSIIALIIGQSNLRHRVNDLERELRERAATSPMAVAVPDASAPMQAVLPVVPPPEAPVDVAAIVASAADPEPETAAPKAATAPATVTPWDRARLRSDAAERPEPEAVSAAAAEVSPPRAPEGPDMITRFATWLKLNWVYAISAASLALAGVFFVQYGIENGILPPGLRVLAGMAFGGCLIGVGEWMRRRHGDGEDAATAYLPSVFAGAGLVSIFAATLAARLMYGLIGPQTAFVGHVLTAGLAIGLGWFYGPLLVAVGLLGAAAAPFLVNGGAEAAPWLYGYFALIAGIGLAVDTLRRWAWVSVLALVLGYGGGLLSTWAGAGDGGWIVLLLALALLAVVIPERGLIPRQDGPSLAVAAMQNSLGAVSFPVKLAAGAGLATTMGLVLMAGTDVAMLAFAALAGLAIAYLLWAEKAEGLADFGFVPAVALWLSLLMQGSGYLPLFREFVTPRGPEMAAPLTVSILLGGAALVGVAFALRAFRGGALGLGYGLASVLVGPVAAVILELFWHPGAVIGAYPWALHAIALAALMVALAVRFARTDADMRRAAYASLSALSLIALALFLVTTKTALTLALAVLALVAAGLDRRFKLPEMGWFIQLAVAVLGYRLLADPGLDWAMAAPLGQVVLAFAGVIAALLAALRLLPEGRILPKGVLESAAAGLGAILANILILRWLLPSDAPQDVETHWSASLNALPWLVLMLMQIYRARLGGVLMRLRQAIAAIAGLLAAGALALAVGPFNPLFSYAPTDAGALVLGPLVIDTLLLAYAMPGLILALAAWRLPGLGRLRLPALGAGLALLALYLGLEIRRFWQGDWLGVPGVNQGELYSYTVAMMLLGAGLLYQAIARRSGMLRRIAMAVIGLTIAKVFLLDAAGLSGLTRVVSFLGLGLSLAGLAWLNRWAGEVSAQDGDA